MKTTRSISFALNDITISGLKNLAAELEYLDAPGDAVSSIGTTSLYGDGHPPYTYDIKFTWEEDV